MTQEIKHSKKRTREYLLLDPELIQRNIAGDEISLFELWAILTRKRILILGILAASIVSSVAIAFLIAPVYQAVIHLQPPLNKDVAVLNIPEIDSEYTTEAVFKAFQNNFKARNNLWGLFVEKQLYKAYLGENDYDDAEIAKVFEKEFLKDMSLHQQSNGQFFINATLNWKDATEGAALLNEYSQIINSKTVEQYVNELNNQLILEKKRIQTQIDLARESAVRTKNYRLAELDENIKIAKELGIKRMEGPTERGTSDVFVGAPGNQLQYYQGYEALEAEKRRLQARNNDDPFSPGLSEKIDELEFLKSIKISTDQISAVRVTQKAIAVHDPIKPKKILIVVLGGVLGVFLGVFIAFFSHAVSGQRAS